MHRCNDEGPVHSSIAIRGAGPNSKPAAQRDAKAATARPADTASRPP